MASAVWLDASRRFEPTPTVLTGAIDPAAVSTIAEFINRQPQPIVLPVDWQAQQTPAYQPAVEPINVRLPITEPTVTTSPGSSSPGSSVSVSVGSGSGADYLKQLSDIVSKIPQSYWIAGGLLLLLFLFMGRGK